MAGTGRNGSTCLKCADFALVILPVIGSALLVPVSQPPRGGGPARTEIPESRTANGTGNGIGGGGGIKKVAEGGEL